MIAGGESCERFLSMLHSKRHKLKPTSQRVLNTEKYVIFSYPCNTF